MIFKKVTKLEEGNVSWRRQKAWEEELEDIALRLENPNLDEKTRAALEHREEVLKAKFDKIRKTEESFDEEGKHETCANCGTMLNDMGTCPKCDEGEEDYGDKEGSDEQEEELLTEGAGADVNRSLKDLLKGVSEENKQNWQRTLEKVLNAIPDSLADELVDKTMETFSDVKLSPAEKTKIAKTTDGAIDEESIKSVNTVGELLNLLNPEELAKKNPGLIKTIVTTILYVVAVLEPTPVIDIIAVLVTAMPETAVANIVASVAKMNPAVKIVSSLLKTEEMNVEEGFLTNVAAAVASKAVGNLAGNLFENKPLRDAVRKSDVSLEEDIGAKEKLINAYPDVDWSFNAGSDEFIEEYDDDYDIDDVEEDRVHAALYGGDRTYCDCGRKLIRTEWGSYCPECDPETAEEEHLRSMYDDEV